MIYDTLQILKEQVEAYFVETGLGKIIALDNIALWESGSDDATKVEDKVVMTLVRLEEETTLKNVPSYKITDNKTEYFNPPVNLNLYVLFSGNCDTYDKSLKGISRIIQFFQGKKVFTLANTVYNRTNVSLDVLDHFKFILEMYSPGFEELNNIWGTLGGRQLPSVIYKVQIIQIKQDKKLGASEVITHVGGNLKDIQ
ncbi:DUF4255 domain-containing protein [Maribellus comscasis]|uniref:DUF4255 domain-containing protein n=1 Tax=Maribellus comscasis TaxID=2681766 RepID=A0A6I6K0T4_9BACT|nr:DUF4255 domain-containing protein [Maribellus comscasis]QGY47038.1 DUF4255 domain-containing protein [Maribellus comscasis]